MRGKFGAELQWKDLIDNFVDEMLINPFFAPT